METIIQHEALHKEISKPLAIRIAELVKSLQLVRDSIDSIRQGKPHHIVALAGQLRALLIEKQRHADPLLLYIARETNCDLSVYALPDLEENPPPVKPEFAASLGQITKEKTLPNQNLISFEKFLKLNVLAYAGTLYSVGKIIDFFANRAGGAHYSKNAPKAFMEMLQLAFGGQPVVETLLVQIGEATLLAGVKLIKELVDFEIHSVIYVPELVKHQVVILDAVYPNSPMRITISLNHLSVPCVKVTGLDRSELSVCGNLLVDWSEPRHVYMTYHVDSSLKTHVNLAFDGDVIGSFSHPEPIFVLNDPVDYDVYFGRAATDSEQRMRLGIGSHMWIGRGLTSFEHANLLIYNEKRRVKPNENVIEFSSGTYGIARAGEREMKISGPATLRKARDILPDWGKRSDLHRPRPVA